MGAFTPSHLWPGVLSVFLSEQMCEQTTLYVAIDRTTWREVNLLMASVIWKGRAIPLYWQLMENRGNSDYTEQTQLLVKALPMLCADKIVVLADREFCSVDLAKWLGEQGYFFCLRQKKSTWMKTVNGNWQKLAALCLQLETQCFYNALTLTKSKGFGEAHLVGKWKRRYRGFAPEEPWFILTNLDTLDAVLQAYQKRFDIEEMFRDLKSGGYSLEHCRAQGKRFLAIVLLIAIAYTCTTSQGQTLKNRALQKYIARPERYDQPYRRHSAFHVGLAAHRWVPFWPRCQQQVFKLLSLDRNKLPYHLKGLKAMDAVLSTFCHPFSVLTHLPA